MENNFETLSAEDVVLAIFDRLGIKLSAYHIFYIGY